MAERYQPRDTDTVAGELEKGEAGGPDVPGRLGRFRPGEAAHAPRHRLAYTGRYHDGYGAHAEQREEQLEQIQRTGELDDHSVTVPDLPHRQPGRAPLHTLVQLTVGPRTPGSRGINERHPPGIQLRLLAQYVIERAEPGCVLAVHLT